MAIEFGTGSQTDSVGYENSLTDSTLAISGTDLVLVVCVASRDVSFVTGITHNGTALTKQATSATADVCGVEIWTLEDPVIGTNDILVSLSDYKLLSMYSFYLKGADAVEATNGNNVASSEHPSNSITTASANALIIDAINLQNTKTMVVDGSQIERNNSDHSDANLGQFGVSTLTKVTAGAQAMGWTWTTTDNWGHALISISATGVTPPDPTTDTVYRGLACSGMEFAKTTIPGVEGTDFTKNETGCYEYAASKGLNVMRVPFLWERVQPTLGGALDPTYLAYIEENIAWAAANGIKAIPECHNYGRREVSGVQRTIGHADGILTTAHFADLWDKLSGEWTSNATVLAYGLMNEPHDMPVPTTPSTYKTTATATLMYQAAVDAIRANSDEKYCIVALDAWSGMQEFTNNYGSNPDLWITDATGSPAESKIIYEGHYYCDDNHSGTYADSFKTTNNANITADVTPFMAWCQAKGVLCMLGEYGVPNEADWQVCLNTLLALCDSYNAWTTHWAMGIWYSSATTIQPTDNYGTDRLQMAIVDDYPGYVASSPSTSIENDSTRVLHVDGIDGYAEVADRDDLSIPKTGELTISFWMNPSVLDFKTTTTSFGSPAQSKGEFVNFLGKGETAQEEWLFRMYNYTDSDYPNRISFCLYNLAGGTSAKVDINETVVVGNWLHIVAKVDAQYINIYRNGVLVSTQDYTTPDGDEPAITPEAGTAPFKIGHVEDIANPGYFEGYFDDVRIYDSALSDVEVAYIYNSGRASATSHADLIHRWRIDETTGTTADNDVADADAALHGGASFGAVAPATDPPVAPSTFAYLNDEHDAGITQGLNGVAQICTFTTKFYTEDVPFFIKRYTKYFCQVSSSTDQLFTLAYRFDDKVEWAETAFDIEAENLDFEFGDGSTGGFSEGYSFSYEKIISSFKDMESTGAESRGVQFKITWSSIQDVEILSQAYKFVAKPNFH